MEHAGTPGIYIILAIEDTKSGGEAAVQRYWVLGIQDTEEDRAGTPGMLVIEDTRVEVRLVQRYWVLGILDTEV